MYENKVWTDFMKQGVASAYVNIFALKWLKW